MKKPEGSRTNKSPTLIWLHTGKNKIRVLFHYMERRGVAEQELQQASRASHHCHKEHEK